MPAPRSGDAVTRGKGTDVTQAGPAPPRSRSRCGPTTYFGSRAEARPASKMPNLVSAEAASSAAPDSAALACPWSQRALIVRRLLGLEQVIGLTLTDPI